MTKVFDFDAGWAEADQEPLQVKMFGRTWDLPASAPAEILLKLDRMMVVATKAMASGKLEEDSDVIDLVETPETILRKLVGDEVVDAWLEAGMGYRQMLQVSRKLIAYYKGEDPDEEQDGDVVPNRQDRRAKKAPAAKPKKATPSSTSGKR